MEWKDNMFCMFQYPKAWHTHENADVTIKLSLTMGQWDYIVLYHTAICNTILNGYTTLKHLMLIYLDNG